MALLTYRSKYAHRNFSRKKILLTINIQGNSENGCIFFLCNQYSKWNMYFDKKCYDIFLSILANLCNFKGTDALQIKVFLGFV